MSSGPDPPSTTSHWTSDPRTPPRSSTWSARRVRRDNEDKGLAKAPGVNEGESVQLSAVEVEDLTVSFYDELIRVGATTSITTTSATRHRCAVITIMSAASSASSWPSSAATARR